MGGPGSHPPEPAGTPPGGHHKCRADQSQRSTQKTAPRVIPTPTGAHLRSGSPTPGTCCETSWFICAASWTISKQPVIITKVRVEPGASPIPPPTASAVNGGIGRKVPPPVPGTSRGPQGRASSRPAPSPPPPQAPVLPPPDRPPSPAIPEPPGVPPSPAATGPPDPPPREGPNPPQATVRPDPGSPGARGPRPGIRPRPLAGPSPARVAPRAPAPRARAAPALQARGPGPGQVRAPRNSANPGGMREQPGELPPDRAPRRVPTGEPDRPEPEPPETPGQPDALAARSARSRPEPRMIARSIATAPPDPGAVPATRNTSSVRTNRPWGTAA